MLRLDAGVRLVRAAAGLPGRVIGLVEEAEDLLAQARQSLASVDTITEDASETLGAARTLTQDAAAMIALVDELPTLTRSLREDILPILGTLDRVGPDINELLHVMDDVRKAVLGVPGFSFFKRRGEEIVEEHPDLDPHPRDNGTAPTALAAASRM